MTTAIAPWRTTYTPGDWVVLAGPTSLVVLQPAPARVSGLLNRFWADALMATSIHELSATLAAHDLAQLSSFGLVFWDGGLHTLARGQVRIVDAKTGDDLAGKEDVATWGEASLGTTAAIRIELASVDVPSLQLPLAVGGVCASSVLITTGPDAIVHSAQVVGGPQPESSILDPSPTEVEPVKSDPIETVPESPGIIEEVPFGSAIADPQVEPVELLAQPADQAVATDESMPPLAEDSADDEAFAVPTAAERPDDLPPAAAEFPATDVPVPPPSAPQPEMVSATVCDQGHVNPPGAPQCRQCSGPVGSVSRLVPRPTLAIVRSSFGVSLELSSDILVGRAPDPKGDATMQVLKVPSPHTDISRSHLRIGARDWQVEVTDLNSTNGTLAAIPGREPLRLTAGEALAVPLGTIVDLGDGVQIRIDPPR